MRGKVDKYHVRKLETLRRVDRQQRDRLRQRGLLGRLADRQVGVDDLVEMANEITDPRERQVTLEPPGELEHLAQVEERSGASVSLSPEFSPAQVSALLEQPVQDVADWRRLAPPAAGIGELDQRHGLSRPLR